MPKYLLWLLLAGLGFIQWDAYNERRSQPKTEPGVRTMEGGTPIPPYP